MKTFSIPIVIIIYHRPDYIGRVLSVIKKIRPTNLWIIADGAKNAKDQANVDQTRQMAEQAITWPCTLHKIYASKNLGPRTRVVTGLNKVFSQEESAIILEDDCLPSPSFFRYCQELLEKYQEDKRLMSISGGNYLFGQGQPINGSYYASKYFHGWGWATWKRAWKLYDPNLNFMKDRDRPAYRRGRDRVSNPFARFYWQTMAKKILAGKAGDVWDYQWSLAHLYYGGVSLIPVKNLVRNIGFGVNATHTKFRHKLQNLKADDIQFPLIHPKQLDIRHDLDSFQEKLVYLSIRSIVGMLLR